MMLTNSKNPDWQVESKKALAKQNFKKYKYIATFSMLQKIADKELKINCADIGCGPAFLSAFSDPRIRIDFYDLHPSLPFVKKLNIDQIKSPLKYNVVISMGCIEYIKDIENFLRHMQRSKISYLVIYFTSINHKLLFHIFKHKISSRTGFKNFLTRKELYVIFSKYGYKNIHEENYSQPIYKLPLTSNFLYTFQLCN